MRNSAEVATDGFEDSPKSPLSDERLAAFWASIVSLQDAARGMARRFVSKKSAEDVVNSAALLFVEALQRPRKPTKFPETDQDFRRKFLAIVRNHALDCVRRPDLRERPIHSHW